MPAVLSGFTVLLLIVLLGYLLARADVLDAAAQQALSRVAFFVATPALLVQVLSTTDVSTALAHAFAVAALSAFTMAAVYLLVARRCWPQAGGAHVIGALTSCYVNAGNLGLPIMVYVLGNGSAIAPVLLLQLLVLAPLAMTVLDRLERTARGSRGGTLGWIRSVGNPITLGCLAGVSLTLTGWDLPPPLASVIELLAGMAVPAMLLAYGVSLRVGPRAFAETERGEVAFVTVLKIVVQPAVAAALGAWLFGMRGHDLLAVTLCAGLPTAQNVFVYASRYDRGTVVARDAVFATSLLSLPSLMLTAILIG